MLLRNILLGLGLWSSTAQSIEVTVEDEKSLASAAGELAYGLVKFYSGNETGDVPGNLPAPYYWWICGAMMGTLIDYWHATGDDQYNDLVSQAIVHQAGPDENLLPDNQTRQMGNDDVGFWGMTVMLAAEYVLDDPGKDEPQWLGLAMAVFNGYVSRWDEENCGGGLRWQVNQFNVGWTYKNSVSNGCFFNIATRLARYTANDSYVEWAEKIYDWEVDMGLILDDGTLRDGVTIHPGKKCQDDRDPTEWSYNSGLWMHGSAILWDYTKDKKWETRTTKKLERGLKKFAKNNIADEGQCEAGGKSNCDDDQRSFKGYWLRWLAAVAALHPQLDDQIRPVLQGSANAAAKACTGTPTEVIQMHPPWEGHPETACGFVWSKSAWDNTYGVTEQMNGVAAMISNIKSKVPKSAKTGGTSKGDPGAGGNVDVSKGRLLKDITMADRVGAGILTTVILAGLVGGCAFLIMAE